MEKAVIPPPSKTLGESFLYLISFVLQNFVYIIYEMPDLAFFCFVLYPDYNFAVLF